MSKTQGETLFEQYLADRGIASDYEIDGGGRRPDYRLRTDPVVYCEVKDFEFGPADRAEMEALNRVRSKGPDALFGRIRDNSGKPPNSCAASRAPLASWCSITRGRCSEEERPDAFVQVPYVWVHHNPFSVAPLLDTLFTGPNDRHWCPPTSTTSFCW
jgi:hypothetical protein